ncbi:MAG: MaoC family dehydratase N-terminal domain-containing protein [Rhizobiaceae bacterium]
MSEAVAITPQIIAKCKAAVGRSRTSKDMLAREAAAKLAVLLGLGEPGEHLPPTFHWAYFNKAIPAADIGHDMHERTGIFLPAAPFNRRMWAAGDVNVLQPLRIGVAAQRRSTIADVAFKEGRSGCMCFVTVDHEIEQEGVRCISEKQTIVYRDRGEPETPLREAWEPIPNGYFVHPDSQLFFYSAITHNGHRIHWDRDFCRTVEGYPDLVVHGPLMATELCEAMRDPTPAPLQFRYRAMAPVFATTPVRLVTGTSDGERTGEVQRSDGVTAMTANLRLL